MQRRPMVNLLRLIAALGICFIAWSRAQHGVVHASVTPADPFGHYTGEGPDNFWDLNYVHCRDGLWVHVQQLKHTGETVDPTNGYLSTEHVPYSLNLRTTQVNGSVLALTTSAPVVSSKPTTDFPVDTYPVYQLAGADGTNTTPLSADVLFQHASQTVGAAETTSFERWDHGQFGLFANGQDDDGDAGGSVTDTDPSDDIGGNANDADTSPSGDTDGDVTDEDGTTSDDTGTGDDSQHDDAISLSDTIQDCSVLPTTTAVVNPAPNTNGWNTLANAGTVSVNFTATDATLTTVDSSQGVDHINVHAQNANATVAITQTLPGASGSVSLPSDGTWTVTYDATDSLGNTETQNSLTVYVDSVGPGLNINGPLSGTIPLCSGAPSRPTFNPVDPNLADGSTPSGVASSADSWTTPSTASAAGTYTYSAHATDKAGNSTSATRTYHVLYPWTSFLVPIAPPKASYKLGASLPVKFQLLCGSTPVTNAVATLFWTQGAKVHQPATSTSSSTTGNLFRYDASSQQYIFNMSTSGLVAGTATLEVDLDDGTAHSTVITLTS